jgi:hypothetical protein
MRSIFWYCVLDIRYFLVYCLYLFACMAYFQSLSLGTDDFGNLQELDEQVFEQQLAENLDK